MALASFYAQAPMLYGIYTPAMAPPPPWQPARNKRKQELKSNDDRFGASCGIGGTMNDGCATCGTTLL